MYGNIINAINFQYVYAIFNEVLLVFNLLTLIALVFFERKNPEKVIRWGGVLLFIPFAGFFLYLFFGRGPSFGRTKKVFTKLENDQSYLGVLDLQNQYINEIAAHDTNIAEMVKYNIGENKSMATINNSIDLQINMVDHYQSLMNDIENAKEYINVLYFIIKPDIIGHKFIELLEKKQREGVQVRLIYDDFGSILLNTKFLKTLRASGAKVFPFFPIKNTRITKNFNYRNHRKIVVIDGKIGYVGGCNIAKEYISLGKLKPWRDTHLRIVGDSVNFLNIRFVQDYNFASGENLVQDVYFSEEQLGENVTQILSCGPDTESIGIESAYIKAIYSAKKSIYLQSPYLVLDEPFKMALVAAARTGIDVRIMIPGVPDKKFVYHTTISNALELSESGVKIYLHKGFIHSKTLCIDENISSVGTFNLDIRSFKLHFEMTAFIYGKEFGTKMIDVFEKDMTDCTVLDKAYIDNQNIIDKMMQRISILFSPLL